MRVRSTATYRLAVLKACAATEAALHVCGVVRPCVLLLLGHMRSGSTLLLHLLMTRPEIAAAGEQNWAYSSRADLARLAIKARLARRSPLAHLRYVVDQVNHAHLTPVPALLVDPRVRVLFLLRRPEASLASLLEMSRSYYDGSWSVARAVDYYVKRLEGLGRLAEDLPAQAHAAYIRYESLIEDPETTLGAVGRWLELSGPLSSRYQIQSFTRSRGDPGTTIAAGTIVRKTLVADASFSESDLQPARRAYEKCTADLARFALP